MSIVTENTVTKLTEEELKNLKTIQENTHKLVMELGEIELSKVNLELRYDEAKKYLAELKELETQFSQEIKEKYGSISINPTTGEITSIDQ